MFVHNAVVLGKSFLSFGHCSQTIFGSLTKTTETSDLLEIMLGFIDISEYWGHGMRLKAIMELGV